MIKLGENGVSQTKLLISKLIKIIFKLSFSMIYIDFYTLLIEMRKFENQFMILIIREWKGVDMKRSLY